MTHTIDRLHSLNATQIGELADVLLDCVAGGASVSFMWPLARETAERFWQDVATETANGERILLVARNAASAIVGTVQVVLAQPDNQPHRADVSKLLVHRKARQQGIADALMRAAEGAALEAQKTVLVLDTASDVAERLYLRLGWQVCGRIPNYALLPDGALCATTILFKQLSASAPRGEHGA